MACNCGISNIRRQFEERRKMRLAEAAKAAAELKKETIVAVNDVKKDVEKAAVSTAEKILEAADKQVAEAIDAVDAITTEVKKTRKKKTATSNVLDEVKDEIKADE